MHFLSKRELSHLVIHLKSWMRDWQELGAMGIHSHDRLLGGTKRDRARACEAALRHAKDLEEEPPEPSALRAAADGTAPVAALTASQANKRVKKYAGAQRKEA